jgi:hypothetical protein
MIALKSPAPLSVRMDRAFISAPSEEKPDVMRMG